MRGGAINIAVYDDKVDVNNIGTLPTGITIEKLKSKHGSFPRNPLIAGVLHAAGYIEMWGRGLEKIARLSKAAGNPEPEFEVTNIDFTVCLPLKEPILSGAVTSAEATIDAGLSTRQKDILQIIKKYEIASIRQVISELKNPPSERMIKKDLNYLKQHGFIFLQGAARNSLWAIK